MTSLYVCGEHTAERQQHSDAREKGKQRERLERTAGELVGLRDLSLSGERQEENKVRMGSSLHPPNRFERPTSLACVNGFQANQSSGSSRPLRGRVPWAGVFLTVGARRAAGRAISLQQKPLQVFGEGSHRRHGTNPRSELSVAVGGSKLTFLESRGAEMEKSTAASREIVRGSVASSGRRNSSKRHNFTHNYT